MAPQAADENRHKVEPESSQERDLRERLDSFRLSGEVETIQQWVRALINHLGGRREIKRNFPRRAVFENALDDADFDGCMAKQKMSPQFRVPFVLLQMAGIDMCDEDFRGAALHEVVRGIIIREVKKRLLITLYSRGPVAEIED